MDRSLNVEIGPLRSDDYERVVALLSLLGLRYSAPVGDPETKRVYRLYLEDDRKAAVAARVSGEVVGVLLFEVTPLLAPTLRHARADGMVVDPRYRGCGIGRRLLREAFRVGAERGVTSFLIKASSPPVIAMYRRTPQLDERGVYFYHNPRPDLLNETAAAPAASVTAGEGRGVS